MPRHPIDDYSYTGGVKFFDQIAEIFRRAVTRGRSVVVYYLISPTAVERMFGNAHEFEMRELHFFEIGHYRVGKIAIRINVTVVVQSPRAYMSLVYGHGGVVNIFVFQLAEIFRVVDFYAA